MVGTSEREEGAFLFYGLVRMSIHTYSDEPVGAGHFAQKGHFSIWICWLMDLCGPCRVLLSRLYFFQGEGMARVGASFFVVG